MCDFSLGKRTKFSSALRFGGKRVRQLHWTRKMRSQASVYSDYGKKVEDSGKYNKKFVGRLDSGYDKAGEKIWI